MRHYFICFFLLCSAGQIVFAQGPYFEKTYGSSRDDQAFFIDTTSDKGFIITGKSKARSSADFDIFLLKLDVNGDQQWFKVINNTGDDWGRAVRQTPDGGYIVGGEMAAGGGLDYTLAKFDASGNLSWQKRYHGLTNDRPSYLQITSDGGFLMCGYNETSLNVSVDGFLLKTDNAGNLEWAKGYDVGGSNEALYGFCEISNGYIATGYTQSNGNSGYVVKVDDNGAVVWSKTYRLSSGYNGMFNASSDGTNFFSVREADDGGIGNRDVWVNKFDATGTMIWSKTYGTSNYDEAFGICHTPTGEFAVAAFTNGAGAGNYSASIFRCDNNGALLWSKVYGGTGDDRIYDIKSVGTDGFVACGYTASSGAGSNDIYILRIDNNGNAGTNCSYNSAGFTTANRSPTFPTTASGVNTYTNSVTLAGVLNQPTLTTNEICKTSVCSLSGNLDPLYQICNDDPIVLDAGNTGSTYQWSTTETTQTISVDEEGDYWVDITLASCSLRVTTSVEQLGGEYSLGDDVTICEGESVTIRNPVTADSYLWSTGSTQNSITVTEAGEYFLDLTINACSTRTDTINIFVTHTSGPIPNLITINQDSMNDYLILNDDLKGGELLIVNKWGKIIYQASVYNNEFNAEGLGDGIYYYHYKSPCKKEFHGWLQVIH